MDHEKNIVPAFWILRLIWRAYSSVHGNNCRHFCNGDSIICFKRSWKGIVSSVLIWGWSQVIRNLDIYWGWNPACPLMGAECGGEEYIFLYTTLVTPPRLQNTLKGQKMDRVNGALVAWLAFRSTLNWAGSWLAPKSFRTVEM